MTTKATLGVVSPAILERDNHTGTQSIDTIETLQATIDDLQNQIDGVSITTGAWVPTLTGITNAASYSMGGNHYFRVGDIVSCFGFFTVTPNSAGTTVIVDATIPIASSFVSSGDLRGHITTQVAQRAGNVFADTANNRARFSYTPESTAQTTFAYSFDYVIL